MAYNFFNSYLTTVSTPSQEYQEKLQALVNREFDNASSYYTIQEEVPYGSGTLVNVNVRINHMINIDTGVRLGDDWREILFKDFDHARSLGQKYVFNNFTWLTINTDYYKYPTASSNVRRCNWTLKWYDDTGVLRQEPCIVEYVKMIGSAMGVVEGRQMREGSYDRFIYLQRNANTLKIKRDQRFFIDKLVFRVTKFDTIGHNGLVELSLDEHQINPEVDDEVNQIADYTIRPSVDPSNVGTTELFVGSSTLSIGTTDTWEIYKKINGVKQADVYTFSIVGSGATIVSYTGNSVVLKAGTLVGGSFVLRATNVGTSAIINKTINVAGMW